MILYFSGTGNSRLAAMELSRALEDQPVDIFSYVRNGVAAELLSPEPWIAVSPTYGWRLPRLFERFLRSAALQGSREIYFVLTCGSEIGNAERYLRRLCGELRLTFRGVLPVVMPENYIALFDAPGPEEARSIVSRALPVLRRGAGYIRAGEAFPPTGAGLADRVRSTVANPIFYRLIVRDRAFAVSDACTGCGACEAACILGNIRLREGKPVWGGRCTHCMACICGCPEEAIEYGRASVGKPRYQCPDRSLLREEGDGEA